MIIQRPILIAALLFVTLIMLIARFLQPSLFSAEAVSVVAVVGFSLAGISFVKH